MKNLMMIVAALAMVVSFLPRAEAGESAELGLNVTFALEPLKLWTEPEGPFSVNEGSELKFSVTAEDLDAKSVTLKAGPLPEGARFDLPLTGIEPRNSITGLFTWTPAVGQNQRTPYEVVFMATSSNEMAGLDMIVKITVMPQPVISIELEPTTWVLKGVKLGEKRDGNFDIKNTGNVSVVVDIGYGPQIQEYPSVQPGLEQGKDTFITEVLREGLEPKVLPPNDRMKVAGINPLESKPLELVYGAPTALSAGIKDHGAKYELRAYGDIVPIDEPLPIIKQ